ncbi:hypothetical protein [Aquimarina litoralis]|uniref:hypothetical protein n=1 Tax=Aquimarina litoralis TaxID=584605 RepID=UPI001C58C960|nr:hypothetical protein [Aquimarina litoralis]MBW1295838.1 hypothetical protein [Aquimarina litoralis]
MRQLFSFLTLLLFWSSAQSQSSFSKTIDATDITETFFILDNTFQIEVTNTSENKIVINAVAEGEYQNHVLLNVKRDQHMLTILDDIQPFSEKHNDKLSAHKVIALKVNIQLPRHLAVTITSKLGSLEFNGHLKSLFVELNSGDCLVQNFIGNAVINTLGGNIELHTKNAKIKTATKSGVISKDKIFGKHQIELKSITGNISVYKTK